MKEQVDTLMHIKQQIETKSKEKARIEGKLESVQKALKDLNCDDIDQAIENEETLVNSINNLQNKIVSGVKDLEKKYAERLQK